MDVSTTVVSSILLTEDEGSQLPVYYLSHSMVPAKSIYSNIEKLALALLISPKS